MTGINRLVSFVMALNIIAIVIYHKGIIIFQNIYFPGNSFQLPLFVFVSGYLFKEKYVDEVIHYICKKIKSLLVPYFFTNLIFGVICLVLRDYNIIKYGEDINSYTLIIRPFLDGHQYGINVAMWFVTQLFVIQVLYVIIRKYIHEKVTLKGSLCLLLILLIMGCFGVTIVRDGNYGQTVNAFLCRTAFVLPFFHMGWMHKKYDGWMNDISNIRYFLILIVTQAMCIPFYEDIVIIDNIYSSTTIVNYVMAVNGILLIWRIAKIISPYFEKSRLIEYIGINTWTVMSFHQFVFLLINIGIYFMIPYFGIEDFDINRFQTYHWYTYKENSVFMIGFYVIAGVGLPLAVKYWFKKQFSQSVIWKNVKRIVR